MRGPLERAAGVDLIFPGQLLHVADNREATWLYESFKEPYFDANRHYWDTVWLTVAVLDVGLERRSIIYVIGNRGHGGWCHYPHKQLQVPF